MATHPFCDDPRATDDWGPRGGHLRWNEVKIRLSQLTCDRMEIEARKWCKTTWLVKPLRKICILTSFRHDLTLTWPDMRSIFEIGLSRSKSMFRTGPTSQTRWCHFYFRVSDIKKVINENPSLWKTIIFHFMTSGTKTVDLRSNLIGKRHRNKKRALQCFFNSS